MSSQATSKSRRQFIKGTAAAAFGFQFVPSTVWGANDRINVACVGAGGKGGSDVTGAAGAGGTIYALCDIDEGRSAKSAKAFSNAIFYKDFRKMLEKEQKNIDAVTVSTPDHTHFHASMMAVQMGKHCYTQKPLSHSIWEARMMTEAAKEAGVVTQMGNQAHAGEPIRRGVELVRAGIVGKVKEVHAWTNRPIWPQGVKEVPAGAPVPDGVDFDLWLGPVKKKKWAYSPELLPFKWRGYWDFGTGALGDMGCHIMDMPYWALDLKYPTAVEAEGEGTTRISGPVGSKVTYTFPGNVYCHDDLKFSWYDGNKENQRMPSEDVFEGSVIDATSAKKFDLVIVGDKGKLFFKRSSEKFYTTPNELIEEVADTPKSIPRVVDEDKEWIDAIRGGNPALSGWQQSGPFTEVVLLGNLALRLGKKIEWDGPNMTATNAPEAAELIRRSYRKSWDTFAV
ncbi:MAG: Gfo/Idh/MocA family oxidoreductase [Verrucomicrobiota bacterium]